MTEIELKYKQEANIVASAIEWFQDRDEFKRKILELDETTWIAYKYLLILRAECDNLKLFDYENIFEIIEEHAHHLLSDSSLLNHIFDTFELLMKIESESCSKEVYFNKVAINYGIKVLKALDDGDNDDKIELYLNVGQRIHPEALVLVPVNVHKAIINLLHLKTTSRRIFANCLLLVDRACNVASSDQLVQHIWCHIKECAKCETTCETCFATIAHLAPHFIDQPTAIQIILNDEWFWKFIQNGLLCGQVHQSKRIIHILRTIIEHGPVINTPYIGSQMTSETWDIYFAVIESMHEVQSHLILSTLDSHLTALMRDTTSFWQNILLTLVLRHGNINVGRYGIVYIAQNSISIYDEEQLADAFIAGLNRSLIFDNWKTHEGDLSAFFASNLNATLSFLTKIAWKATPLWYVLGSITNCVLKTPANANVPTLVKFLKLVLDVFKQMRPFKVHAFDRVFSVIHAVGLDRFGANDLIHFYECTASPGLMAGLPPLSSIEFETYLLGSSNVSTATKLAFLAGSFPDLNQRLDFLDSYAVDENDPDKRTDYEIMLFDNLVVEKSLIEAIELCKGRIYSIMKPKHLITVTSLCAGVKIVEFITTKYKSNIKLSERNHLLALYENMIAAYQSFDSRNDESYDEIGKRLKLINATLCLANLAPDWSILTRDICEAWELNDFELNLSVLKMQKPGDLEPIQTILDFCLNPCRGLKVQTRAKNLISILTEFPDLNCPILQIFDILAQAEQPIDCLLKIAADNCDDNYVELLMKALFFGKELKGDQRLEYEIGARLDCNALTYNQCVRLSAMKHIQQRNSIKLIRELKTTLFNRNTETHRPRYFNHCFQHSLKLRYMQALALMFKLDPVWDDRLITGILNENNQPNVTFINELIIAETIQTDHLLSLLSKVDGNKGLHSFFIISFYVCLKHRTNTELHRFMIKYLMEWCLTKNLNVRATAQSVLVRLIEKCNLIEANQFIYNCIKNELESSEQIQYNRMKKWYPLQDARLNYINCQQLLNSVYYLCEIPRITNMCADETYAIGLDDYDAKLLMKNEIPVNCFEWGERHEREILLAQSQQIVVRNVQKKVVPLKQTFVDAELLNSLPIEIQLSLEKSKIQSDLIVVASLVSKLPNLGGISRTCEVLGAKQYVINNLNDKDRNEYQALSMGSEKWLNCVEIKPQYLADYIVYMKAKGYVIIGAEQTTFSKKLQQTTLPTKTILILGQEKDGIPPNIINLLDIAVEIPQFGVVRSLNVHVSAALFIWEYCKQHITDT